MPLYNTKMSIATDESVLPIVRDYKENFMEQQAILNEIKQYKKRYEKRLKEIKERLSVLERDLIEYMDKNDHPGLRFQEVILLKEDKKSKKNRRLQEEELQNIMHKYSIDPHQSLYREVIQCIQSGSVQSGNKKLKLKIYDKK